MNINKNKSIQDLSFTADKVLQKKTVTNNAKSASKTVESNSLDLSETQGRAQVNMKFSPNGSKIISKKRIGADILDKKSIPESCSYVDIIRGETDFGKEHFRTSSYYDENGNILKLERVKTSDGEVSEKFTRSYVRQDGVIFSRTEIMHPGEPVKVTKEAFYVRKNNDGKKSLSRMKLDIKNSQNGFLRQETQVYEDLFPDKEKITHIKTKTTRLANGAIGNSRVIEGDKNIISQAENDPYFLIRHYDINDFADSVASNSATKQNTSTGYFMVDELPEDVYGQYNHAQNKVTVDTTQMYSKSHAVDTINHEYRHKYQHELVDRLKSNSNLTNEEKELAAEFLEAILKYPRPVTNENFKEYYNNFLEVDARKSGSEAEQEFIETAKQIAKSLDVPLAMLLGFSNNTTPENEAATMSDILIIDKQTLKTYKKLAEKLKEKTKLGETLSEIMKNAPKISLSDLQKQKEATKLRPIIIQNPAQTKERRLIEITV